MAEDIVDPHPLIEVIAEAVRKALPKACSANGTIDEYTIARAVYAAAEITALRKERDELREGYRLILSLEADPFHLARAMLKDEGVLKEDGK